MKKNGDALRVPPEPRLKRIAFLETCVHNDKVVPCEWAYNKPNKEMITDNNNQK